MNQFFCGQSMTISLDLPSVHIIKQSVLLATFIMSNLPDLHEKMKSLRQKEKINLYLTVTNSYRRIQKDTKGYRRIPKDIKEYRRIPKNTERYQRISRNTEGYRQLQTTTNRY